jgi:hypothetical protein
VENSGHLLPSESSVCRSLLPYRNPWQVFPYMGVCIHDEVTLANVMSLCAFLEVGVLVEEILTSQYLTQRFFFRGGGVVGLVYENS